MTLYLRKYSYTNNFDVGQFFNQTDEKEKTTNTSACNLCTEETASLCLVEKIIEIAIENQEFGLVIATAIAVSIIIHIVSKSVSEILITLHKYRN